MSEEVKIDIRELPKEEREVLILLERMGKYLYGNIFRDLSLSQSKGASIILSLLTKGYIQHVGSTSYYELTSELKK